MLDTGSIPVEGTRPVNQRAWYVYRMCKLCGSLKHWFSRGTAAISIVLAGLVFGCDARHDAGSRIDAEWHRSNLVDGLMAAQMATGVPVFSVSLTPHNYQPVEALTTFYRDHFVKKGEEAANAVRQVLDLDLHLAGLDQTQAV